MFEQSLPHLAGKCCCAGGAKPELPSFSPFLPSLPDYSWLLPQSSCCGNIFPSDKKKECGGCGGCGGCGCRCGCGQIAPPPPPPPQPSYKVPPAPAYIASPPPPPPYKLPSLGGGLFGLR
ncbi:hypothetical protein QQG55_21260 [Brugia pahangi]|uniref:Uncharacterized protein n=1 Tax=Brugia pahangi TaxID=6280 RepID=A0A0N4T0Z6_BRUPA|nr:unnamed protein product [Brugia pahangi]